MTSPVGRQQHIIAQQPAAQVSQPAPGGLGGAPTTIEARDPAKIGYVETAVLAIKDFLIWLFSKIFCCFKKEEPAPAVAPPAALPPAPVQQPAPVLPPPPLLAPDVQRDIDLLNEFQRLDPEAQDRIYIKIGQGRHLRFMRWGEDLSVGKKKVQETPQLLEKYIIRP